MAGLAGAGGGGGAGVAGGGGGGPAVVMPASFSGNWVGGKATLTISAAGVVIPMLLGVDYAAGRVLPIPALDLRTMALVHGDLNALVFALLGFVGWMLA